MAEKKQYKSVYFVGAGGIGMAALVRYYLSKGLKVAGYDRTRTALTDELTAEGAEITYDDAAELIPGYCRDKATTLVVYTPAVPSTHPGLTYFRDGGFDVMKRAQVLGLLTHDSKGLYFMLSQTSPYTVIEADEFDRSFHWLNPYIAVVTATDPDHLDIYGTEEAYLESFAHFTELIQPGGTLICHTGLKLRPRPQQGVAVYHYSRNEGDFHAENVRKGDGEIVFDFVSPKGTIKDVKLGVPVDINIENAVAAMAVCQLVGVPDDVIRNAVGTFLGPKRRFEFWLKESGKNGKVIIDDYAHHPDELKASIRSVKDLYPNRRLTVVFQPHLYTRTRDFAPQFAEALSLADDVLLLDIYPARELPIPGVTSEIILKDIKCKNKALCNKNSLVETIKNYNFDVLLTVGAGDICNYLPQICEVVKQKH